jgi:hypothetical protein
MKLHAACRIRGFRNIVLAFASSYLYSLHEPSAQLRVCGSCTLYLQALTAGTCSLSPDLEQPRACIAAPTNLRRYAACNFRLFSLHRLCSFTATLDPAKDNSHSPQRTRLVFTYHKGNSRSQQTIPSADSCASSRISGAMAPITGFGTSSRHFPLCLFPVNIPRDRGIMLHLSCCLGTIRRKALKSQMCLHPVTAARKGPASILGCDCHSDSNLITRERLWDISHVCFVFERRLNLESGIFSI